MKQKCPFILTIFSMILGVFIAVLFGVNEHLFKDKIKRDLGKNEKIMAIVDEGKRAVKLNAEASKNWRYYQRFHFHSTGIASMALGVLILLSFSMGTSALKLLASYMVSIGGFLYPFVWLFAALYGPIMGRSAAKESFAIFGYMGGVFLLGLLLSLFIIIKYPLKFARD
ncbi:MAG: hypothetical protein E2O68_08760 [Deltaproteobacteria bacterium]|nr:MAG: hypothetical protein E2O68_08760 [Deltaproteobacteria bacterium]